MSNSTRSAKGRTSVFASRRSTLKGSQNSPKQRKSKKIDEKLLRRCFTKALREKNSIFSLPDAARCRFWAPRCAPECSRALLPASRDALGDLPGAPGACRGRSQDAPETSLGPSWAPWGVPMRVPGPIWGLFWVPRGPPGTDVGWIFALIFSALL